MDALKRNDAPTFLNSGHGVENDDDRFELHLTKIDAYLSNLSDRNQESSRQTYLENYMTCRQKRAAIICVLIAAGVTAGWLSFNFALDYLLGGRMFG
ncbi:hypothetical protein [Pseudacidovorax intermedius]|uniref:hypothetical protein n=1 Tax=Pseudacidovorax intermedius TaxID=433924 RepID=UPI0012DE7D5B|nr:hypothetical protein [Pseudacidovorax intermedius]